MCTFSSLCASRFSFLMHPHNKLGWFPSEKQWFFFFFFYFCVAYPKYLLAHACAPDMETAGGGAVCGGVVGAIYGPDRLRSAAHGICGGNAWLAFALHCNLDTQRGTLLNPDGIKKELTAESQRHPSPCVEVATLPIDQLERHLEEEEEEEEGTCRNLVHKRDIGQSLITRL